MKLFLASFCLIMVSIWEIQAQNISDINLAIPPFTVESASKFSNIAFNCIQQEYPNLLIHQLNSSSDVLAPSKLHPAFYGCSNWHSAVQSYWLIVKMLKQYPNLPNRERMIEELSKNISEVNIQAEMKYFKGNQRSTIEQPYGWAWILKLTSELATFDSPYAQKWYKALLPFSEQIKGYYYDYLPGLYYPVRKGGKTNTAFALSFALDYSRIMGDKTFEKFIIERASFYFLNDRSFPASWEPDGDDFLSPALVEANLMRRVLPKDEFVRWFKDFMPELPFSLMHPVVVTNREKNGEMNLDGLNLTRAWHLFELAMAIPDDLQLHRDLWQSGYRHATESLPNVLFDENLGDHWLTTFAVCMYLALPQ